MKLDPSEPFYYLLFFYKKIKIKINYQLVKIIMETLTLDIHNRTLYWVVFHLRMLQLKHLLNTALHAHQTKTNTHLLMQLQ